MAIKKVKRHVFVLTLVISITFYCFCAQKLLADDIFILGENNYKIEVEKYTKEIKANQHNATVYFKRGLCRSRFGDFAGAICDYDKAIELQSLYAVAYSYRGVAKANFKDGKGAMDDCNKAIEIDPLSATAYNNRGMVKNNIGDYSGAIKDYDKAISIDSSYAALYVAA